MLTAFNLAKKEDLTTDFGSGENGLTQVDSDLEEEINPKALKNSDKKNAIKNGVDFKAATKEDTNEMFEEEDMGEGDQFMAVKPWKGVVDNS
mmetsp:Transcript_5140/g.3596  ORF Transcript_5140/g.3596 Transcript_5140/m.3596 type:complete len:92 (+) Transcript_5140:540-815(+)